MSRFDIIKRLGSLLPPLEVLPDGTPRYPNLWLHVETPDGHVARAHAWSALQRATGMVDDLPEDHGPEGSDEWARHRGLEPVELAEGLSHDHQLHLRIYHEGLGEARSVSVGDRHFSRVAVSVHYEVDQPHELHPYVDECPLCGCVGTFAEWMDADRHGKNVWVHDPLGLELTISGTADGRVISDVPGLVPSGLATTDLSLGAQELERIGIDAPRLDLVILDAE